MEPHLPGPWALGQGPGAGQADLQGQIRRDYLPDQWAENSSPVGTFFSLTLVLGFCLCGASLVPLRHAGAL